MKIVEKKVGELHPYERNPRKNDKAVDQVAESIKQFGFKVPVVIDANNVIVCGHTRLKAAKKLGIDKVPCVVADDLTEDQIKAFRLADNKVSEIAEWDFDLLDLELEDIDLDMTDFGFEYPEEEDGYYGDERERTVNTYNLPEYDPDKVEGFYQMPVLEPCDYIPDDVIGFNYVLNTKDRSKGVHFYIDDYQFERIWNDPHMYIEKLMEFPCAFTPDFSLYREMPMAMKIWNVYRSRLIGQMMQRVGIPTIPTVSWCEEDTFQFCFDGLPKNAVLSISTIGVKREDDAYNIWKAGVDEMIKRLQPAAILIYGGKIEYNYGSIKTVYYSNQVTERMSRKGD